MASAQRLFQRMQRTKSGWGWADLDTLYRGFGFEAHEGGSHTVYTHPEYPQLVATVARHRELAVGYAQTAVKLIRQLQELRAQQDQEDEDGND